MSDMEIIYVSTLISENKMNYIISNSKKKPLQSIQKYHRLLCEGFIKNGITVKTISSIPMSRKISNKFFFFDKKELINGIEYNYIYFLNIKIIRQIFTLFGTIINVIKETKKKKNKVFICDILNTTISSTTLLLCKIFKIKCIAIVTDLPKDIGKKYSISKKINTLLQTKYDGYIILTEAMNEIVNPKGKPSVIIEGIVNEKKENKEEIIEKYNKKVLLYAGGLYEKYGVKMLIDAVELIKDQNIELHLYGSGDLEEYILNLKNKRIKYYGVVKNDIIIEEEKKVSLLVNPRFTSEEYTKYSFPSKNMEYMNSGTPVLTTRLQGMPKTYEHFVYLFDFESVEGYRKKIVEIINIKEEQLKIKGEKAKDFVQKYKNNIIQAHKAIELIEGVITNEKSNQ